LVIEVDAEEEQGNESDEGDDIVLYHHHHDQSCPSILSLKMRISLVLDVAL
jgi:hypothetical protein